MVGGRPSAASDDWIVERKQYAKRVCPVFATRKRLVSREKHGSGSG